MTTIKDLLNDLIHEAISYGKKPMIDWYDSEKDFIDTKLNEYTEIIKERIVG